MARAGFQLTCCKHGFCVSAAESLSSSLHSPFLSRKVINSFMGMDYTACFDLKGTALKHQPSVCGLDLHEAGLFCSLYHYS